MRAKISSSHNISRYFSPTNLGRTQARERTALARKLLHADCFDTGCLLAKSTANPRRISTDKLELVHQHVSRATPQPESGVESKSTPHMKPPEANAL